MATVCTSPAQPEPLNATARGLPPQEVLRNVSLDILAPGSGPLAGPLSAVTVRVAGQHQVVAVQQVVRAAADRTHVERGA